MYKHFEIIKYECWSMNVTVINHDFIIHSKWQLILINYGLVFHE